MSLVCTPLFSLEWGGVFTNNSSVNTGDLKQYGVDQSDSLFLWLSCPVTKDNRISFIVESMYRFNYLLTSDKSLVLNDIDIDLCKLQGDYILGPGLLSFSAGRFYVHDLTSVLLAQLIDGGEVSYDMDWFVADFVCAYTGLLNCISVKMLNEDGISAPRTNNIYSLNFPYLILKLNLGFPIIFGNQSVAVEGLALYDFSNAKKNRYYADVALSGPITNKFFYKVASSFGTFDFDKVMNYTSVDFYFYDDDNVGLIIGGEYASGDYGKFTSFRGITSRRAFNSYYYPETTNLLVPNVGISFQGEKIYTELRGKSDVTYIDNKFNFEGVEADFALTYVVYSDLQFNLSAFGYYDFIDQTNNNFALILNFALLF